MRLLTLIEADIYRDGGSYGALFVGEDCLEYGLWLERSRMPDVEGLHHRWLFEYRGSKLPAERVPIVTGSIEEQRLIRRIQAFLAQDFPVLAPASWHQGYDIRLERLKEMLHYIIRREPCFLYDLRAAGFVK